MLKLCAVIGVALAASCALANDGGPSRAPASDDMQACSQTVSIVRAQREDNADNTARVGLQLLQQQSRSEALEKQLHDEQAKSAALQRALDEMKAKSPGEPASTPSAAGTR